MKHAKVQVEAIAAAIEPIELRRKVEKEMRYNLIVHDPDALFNIIDHQLQDHALIDSLQVTIKTNLLAELN